MAETKGMTIRDCPFCGYEATFQADAAMSYKIQCINDDCRAKVTENFPAYYDEVSMGMPLKEYLRTKLVLRWNMRAGNTDD